MRKLVLYSLPALFIACMGMTAANADPSRDKAQSSPDFTNAGMKAGRVFLDPETGELGPPPKTAPSGTGIPPSSLSVETRHKLDRSSEGLQARTLSDGTLLLNLQGRFQNFSVATLDRHGKAHLSCSHSVDDIERTLGQEADPAVGKSDP